MPLLSISTATAACSAALLDGRTVLAERHEVVGRGHAERLVPMIAELLDGAKPSAILVDCGPGSFTGLRVGLAAARGLGIGWRVPVSGMSSLSLIAAGAGSQGDEIDVAIAGGHGELFVQRFGAAPLAPLAAPASLSPVLGAGLLRAERVLGNGAEALVAARGWGVAVDALPRAADARLLPETLTGLPPRPIYVRSPDAKPAP